MADLNFLNGVGQVPGRNVGALQLAAEYRAQRKDPMFQVNKAVAIQRLEATGLAMKEKAYDMQLRMNEREAMAEINGIMANGAFDDPATESSVFKIAAQRGLSAEALDPILKRFDTARNYKQRIAEINAQADAYMDRFTAQQERLPERLRILEQARSERTEAEKLRAAGDVEGYQRMMAQSEETASTVKQYGETFTGFGDQGQPIFQVSRGGPSGSGMSPATVGFQTKAQGVLAKYENATVLLNDLAGKLRPEDVGAAGLVGEWVFDRTLAQINPEVANKERIDNRVGLGMLRESLMREVSEDARFSNADRTEITRLLPSSGVFESHARAVQNISRVRDIIADRSRVYAERMGEPVPELAMTADEVRSRYGKQVAAIDASLASGRITQDQAAVEKAAAVERASSTLKRFHGFTD